MAGQGCLVLRIFLWGVLQKVYIVRRVEARNPPYIDCGSFHTNGYLLSILIRVLGTAIGEMHALCSTTFLIFSKCTYQFLYV